jgi:uncharacterized caspase-like protein
LIADQGQKAPDRAQVIEGLRWLEEGSERGDVSLLFLAGHGITDKTGQFFFLAADSDLEKKELNDTAISRDRIVQTIKKSKGSVVVMFDACRSGANLEVNMNRLPNELSDEGRLAMVYASSSAKLPSYEAEEWGNGAFTKALIEGLSGKADHDNTGSIDADELGLYVRRRVEAMTKKAQIPSGVIASAITLAKH